MFTGIIKSIGSVTKVVRVSGGKRLSVDVGEWAVDCADGDSICVSGVCLTVAARRAPVVEFDVINETLQRSILGDLAVSGRVNLERAMAVGERFDGHFVQGHVDGTACVTQIISSAQEQVIWFKADRELVRYVIPKGSIAIDGVSLTIAAVKAETFSVALIPTTLDLTTLGSLAVGDRVNIESDIIARTIVHHMSSVKDAGGLNVDALREAGFA